MSSPKTPPPPDPVATAAAQSAANRDTAITQQAMNMIDQIGPDGSLTYTRTGEDSFVDSLSGKSYQIPRYAATQTLSASGQRLKAINDQTMENIAGIGRDQSARISELLGKPIDLTNEAVEGRLSELGSRRLDPRFAREEEALRTRLVNQGIRQGSDAWSSAMNDFNQGKNDAYNQLALTGRGQAVQEILAERSTPINEITALLSGAQITPQNFVNTPQTQVGGTDYMGAVYQSHNAAVQAAKMKSDSQNALMGGLFGLAGNLGGMAIYKSDRRLKRDIVKIGQLDNGLPIYSFRYRDGDEFHIGLMSDDVRKTKPEAVIVMRDGFDAVDYRAAVH